MENLYGNYIWKLHESLQDRGQGGWRHEGYQYSFIGCGGGGMSRMGLLLNL
jgi:hypothetical protein